MAILNPDDGVAARTPEEATQLAAAGHVKCATHKASIGPYQGGPCGFYMTPEAHDSLKENGGYYTCPVCKQSHDALHEMPWHGVAEDEMDPVDFQTGGGTRIGLKMDVQGQIGEDLIEKMGEIPGYGPLTWWHQGGAATNSPLDGATEEWGVEVKTIGYDSMHHRFIPGRPREKQAKNDHAAKMGKKGVLAVLVLLDYRRSIADIFVHEYPIETGGVKAFRTTSPTANHLVKEVPFQNPLMDPKDPSPYVTDPNKDMPF